MDLPKDAWPCGKLVAATEVRIQVLNDGRNIKRNRAQVDERLTRLGIKVEWCPSS
jgi:hypothetical protein